MKTFARILFLSFSFLINTSLFADIIYVNVNASGNNDGSSWGDAYSDLQIAINEAQIDDELWVAAGVYLPSMDYYGDPNPTDPTNKRFVIKKEIRLYGGFLGNETNLTDRNHADNLTIISGDLDQNDENTDGNNIAESYTHVVGNNCKRLLQVEDAGKGFVIDGLIMTGGTLSGQGHNSGMVVVGKTEDAQAIIRNCRFHGNRAYRGAGLTITSTSPNKSEAIIEDCIFSGNLGTDRASGIYFVSWSGDAYMTVDRCIFENNEGGLGTIFNHGGFEHASIITNSIFRNNTTDGRGGAIFLFAGGNHLITNCTFVQNHSGTGGGAIRMESTSPTILKNCIFYDNSCDIPSDANLSGDLTSFTISHSLLSDAECPMGLNCEEGMIFGEIPLFVDSPFDLHLMEDSPCVDTGTDDGAPSTDLDGNERPLNGTLPDMGAYEWHPPSSTDRIELENISIFAYPNPTTDKVFIEIDGTPNDYELTLINVNDQSILQSKISDLSVNKTFSLEAFPSGSYWLRVSDNGNVLGFIKLIKL